MMKETVKCINKSFLEAGKNLLPKIAGASATCLLAGEGVNPLLSMYGGHMAGALVDVLFNFANDIDSRAMSNMEKERVSATYIIVRNQIRKRIDDGYELRNDGFFNSEINDRSSAEEIFEGFLLAAQKEYEQKKIIFYANLVAGISTDNKVNRAEANQLIKMVEKLSYRQICIIAGLKDSIQCMSNKNSSLLIEAFDLYKYGIMYAKKRQDNVGSVYIRGDEVNDIVINYKNIVGKILGLDNMGKMLYDYMMLKDFSNKEDVHNIVCDFRG